MSTKFSDTAEIIVEADKDADDAKAGGGIAKGLRLIILNQFFYPDHSATSQLMTDLAESLTERGVEVTAVAGRGRYNGGKMMKARETHKGAEIYRAWSTGFGKAHIVGRLIDYVTFYFGALIALMRLPRHDIIMSLTTPPLIGLVALIVGRWRGMRVITLTQDLYPDVAVALKRIGARHPLVFIVDKLNSFTLRHSDRIIVLGERMRQRVLDKVGTNKESSIDVIHNWADGNLIQARADKNNRFARRNNLREKFVVLFSGNLGHVNDFRAVFDAAWRLRERADIHFLFIGEGAKAGDVLHFAGQHGLSNLELLPYQARAELSDVYATADVLLVTLADGLAGLSVLSKTYGSLAAGRPLMFIGDMECETANIISEFGCGEIFAAGEGEKLAATIADWSENPGLVRDLGRIARDAFETNFERALAVNAYLAAFDLCLHNNRDSTTGYNVDASHVRQK